MRDIMLIVHFIGLAMGVGTSFAFLFLGKAASRLSQEEAVKFMNSASRVSTMGHIGLGLLILSGGYLMTPFWGALPAMPVLVAKLALVVVLTVLISMAAVASKKARGGDSAQQKKAARLGPFLLLSSLTIIVLAVLVFH